jgi:hypothetical protein
LQHTKRCCGDLRIKIAALALAQTQILLALTSQSNIFCSFCDD